MRKNIKEYSMAYLPMTQETIRFMNKDFNKEKLSSYQQLIKLFGTLFANEKEFLKDPGDRMGLSHYVENFLRKNNFQTIVTIKDLNLIFNSKSNYDIYNIELYKVFFVLIYEELSSNDPQISFMIKEAISKLINIIDAQELKEKNIPQKVKVKRIKNKNNLIINNKQQLYEYIIQKKLLPYKCNICGASEWQGKILKLELDSLDGIYNNSNIKNLKLLCPNCYSQVGHYEYN